MHCLDSAMFYSFSTAFFVLMLLKAHLRTCIANYSSFICEWYLAMLNTPLLFIHLFIIRTTPLMILHMLRYLYHQVVNMYTSFDDFAGGPGICFVHSVAQVHCWWACCFSLLLNRRETVLWFFSTTSEDAFSAILFNKKKSWWEKISDSI